jgi:endonuclease YncB( thermonuclease family)
VIDGDTLILDNGRHVRLLGIDAPELGHWGKTTEAYGPEAKAALAGLIRQANGRIQLFAEGAYTDRYGRSLAHAFLPDGTNIQAWLLQRGFTRRYTASQGKHFEACYTAAEASAVAAKEGVWSLPAGPAIAAEALPPNTRGFRTVAGIVRRINRTNASVWLELAPNFALRIAREDWQRFPMAGLNAWQGRRLTARGYVYARDGQLRIRITDPSQLEAG